MMMIIVINRWSVAAGCANRGLRRADSTTADRRCYDKLLNCVLHSEQLVLNPLNVIALYTALELYRRHDKTLSANAHRRISIDFLKVSVNLAYTYTVIPYIISSLPLLCTFLKKMFSHSHW